MNRVSRQSRRLLNIAMMVVSVSFGASLITGTDANAQYGSGGSGTGGGGGAGHWTSNGFGWKKFPKSGSGPNAGFANGTSWSTVRNLCSVYDSNYVWVHVVRNSSGAERSFNYAGSPYWGINRPLSGGDPYVYNAAGNYQWQGPAHQQHVINIVTQVYYAFMVGNSAGASDWGYNVAWFCDGPRERPWSISASTGNAEPAGNNQPGQAIRFRHSLSNAGPNSTNKAISYQTRIVRVSHSSTTSQPANATIWNAYTSSSYTSARSNYPAISSGRSTGVILANSNFNQGTNDHASVRHSITQNDVNNWICGYIAAQPRSHNNNDWVRSAPKCVFIPYNYSLTPSVSTDMGSVIDAEAKIVVTPTIGNSGPTKSRATTWRLTRIIVDPGGSIPNSGGGNHSNEPCTASISTSYFRNSSASCSTVVTGNDVVQASGLNISSRTVTIGDLSPGTRVCFSLSVTPRSSGSPQWRHSAPTCAIVGKKPKVQVWGGDLMVGRVFPGSSVDASSSRVVTSLTEKTGETSRASDAEIKQQERATQRYWYFGNRAGLNFGISGNGTPAPISTTFSVDGSEGTTVAVNTSGQLQFFTDGLNVYRSNGSKMPSGQGVGSTSTTTQAAASFPLAGNKYAIIVTSAKTSDSGSPSLGRLFYSIVDMNEFDSDGQRGRVTTKRQPFGPAGDVIGEALSVVPTFNISGSPTTAGYWVVTNEVGTNRMRAYKIPYTWNGLNGTSSAFNPVVSSTGTTSGQGARGFGAINFADFDTMTDRSISAVIAMSATSAPSSAYLNDSVRVLNFDRQSGQFQERLNWKLGQRVYTADFSPDGKYVYVTSLYNAGNRHGNLYRYNIFESTSRVQVENSVHKIADAASGTGLASCDPASPGNGGGHVKRGPDGKMYVANWGCSALGVVRNPDAANSSIGWQPTGRTLASGSTSRYGLPQMAISPSADESPVEYDDVNFGSWIEYGIFAPNYVSGTASASGLNGSAPLGQSSWSRLTFANDHAGSTAAQCNSGSYRFGCYTVQNETIPDVRSSFTVTSSTPRISGNRATNQIPRGVSTSNASNSTITLTGGSVARGYWHVINAPNATVNITGNITYSSMNMRNAADIPQLVIIARDINIAANVSRVDAWLITPAGAVVTCSARGTAAQLRTVNVTGLPTAYRLSRTTCATPLTINGPIMAETLWLRRTAGSGTGPSSGDPAEIINMRPDAYLWANEIANQTPRAQTVFTVEDAPRL